MRKFKTDYTKKYFNFPQIEKLFNLKFLNITKVSSDKGCNHHSKHKHENAPKIIINPIVDNITFKEQNQPNSFDIEIKQENRGGRIYSSDEVLVREKNERQEDLDKLKCVRKISENVDLTK